MATHSSILAWRIPWTEEHGGLQFMGSQRVEHNWVKSNDISIAPNEKTKTEVNGKIIWHKLSKDRSWIFIHLF